MTAAETIPLAGAAAYGAQNIETNALNNPYQVGSFSNNKTTNSAINSGLEMIGNTGLSLATLSIPPQIFQSIGKDITNVLSDIGKFFGGLF